MDNFVDELLQIASKPRFSLPVVKMTIFYPHEKTQQKQLYVVNYDVLIYPDTNTVT